MSENSTILNAAPAGDNANANAPAAGAPAPAAPASVPAGTWVNPDGSLKDGWIDAVVPEDLRDQKSFKSFTDLPGMAKTLGVLSRMVGKQGKGVMPLDEHSTPSEVEAFYKAIGRPDAPDGYKVEVPDDVKEYYQPEQMKAVLPELHKLGLTQAQVAGVLALDQGRLREAVKAREEGAVAEQARSLAENQAKLQKMWGSAEEYQAKIASVRQLIGLHAMSDQKESIAAAVGNNAEVLNFLATISSQFHEHHLIDDDGEGVTNTLQGRLSEIENTPGFVSGSLKQANRAQFDSLLAERNELYKKLHPTK
jgi:hypothetical protein